MTFQQIAPQGPVASFYLSADISVCVDGGSVNPALLTPTNNIFVSMFVFVVSYVLYKQVNVSHPVFLVTMFEMLLTIQCLARLDLHREAKVCELYVHVIIQENVLWLQVPVDNVLGVEELNHLQQSSHNIPTGPRES